MAPDSDCYINSSGSATIPVVRTEFRDICIKKAENGFIVSVGCKTLVFIDFQLMVTALAEYYDDPDAVYKKYCKG